MRLPACMRAVTVEPSLFLNTLALAFLFVGVQNLVVQKSCSPQVQPPIDFICNDTAKVSSSADIALAKSTVKTILSVISIPLIGSWRDVTGNNRLIIFLSQITEILIAFMYLISAWSWSSSPWLPNMFEAIVGGLVGDNTFQLAATCVIAENSTPENRTARFQYFILAMVSGGAVGAVVYGILLTSVGYVWYFTIVILCYITSLILAMVLVESKPNIGKRKNLEIIKKLKFVFKWRPNCSVIWIILVSGSILSNISSGETSLLLYYLQRAFHLTLTDCGLYGAYRMFFSILGGFIMSPLFTKVFKWSDFQIGIASALLTMVSAIAMSLAATKVELFLYPALEILKYVLSPLPKSIISKCVENDQLGTFMGFGSIVAVFMPFILNYIYKKVFSATSDKMPGAFFLVSAAGYAVVLIAFCISLYLYDPTKDQSAKSSNRGTANIDPEGFTTQTTKETE